MNGNLVRRLEELEERLERERCEKRVWNVVWLDDPEVAHIKVGEDSGGQVGNLPHKDEI